MGNQPEKNDMDIYDRLLAAGVPLDNHESDLYAKVTPESTAIVRIYAPTATRFTNQLDGQPWYDIAFAYTPWWTARQKARP